MFSVLQILRHYSLAVSVQVSIVSQQNKYVHLLLIIFNQKALLWLTYKYHTQFPNEDIKDD